MVVDDTEGGNADGQEFATEEAANAACAEAASENRYRRFRVYRVTRNRPPRRVGAMRKGARP